MLRRFTGRMLLAAKTSVKEPVKAKTAAKKKEKKVQVEIDRSKFHHNDWLGTTIFDLAKALPQPELPQFTDRDTWLHKNGQGLKFYRPLWTRYPEPCYWTVAKIKLKKKPAVKHSRVWGFLTWRGRTEPLPRVIPGSHRKEWRILLEPGTQLGPSIDNCWTAPEITLESDPKLSTQLPEDLPGVKAGTWPYPWGKLGTRNFPREPPSTEKAKEAAQKRVEDVEADKSEHEEELMRAAAAHHAAIELGPPSQVLSYYFDAEGERMQGTKAEAGTPLFDEDGEQVATVVIDEHDGTQSIVEVDARGRPMKQRASAAAAAAADMPPSGDFDEDLLEHDEDENDDEDIDEDEDEDGLDEEDKQWQMENEENPATGEMDAETMRRGSYQKRSERRGLIDEDEDEDDEIAESRMEKEMQKEERARRMRRRALMESGRARGTPRYDEDGEEIDEEEEEEDVNEDEDEEGEEDAEAALEDSAVEEAPDADAEAEAADAEAEAAEGESLEGEVAEGEAAEGEAADTADAAAGAKGRGKKQ